MNGVRSWTGFVSDNLDGILARSLEHLTLVAGVMLAATVFSVVLGIVLMERPLARQIALGVAGVLLTIPSLALFAVFIPLVGIGNRPAQIALFLYAILPILRNTVTGLGGVDEAVVESARGMGMGPLQQLLRVRVPLAWPVVMAGVRVSTQLVTGIAAIHYFYMREVWALTNESPIVFRYVDWLLTVPLQIVEFFLILSAIAVVRASLFWKLLIASLVMLITGYIGEVEQGALLWPMFIVGTIAWLYIIYEIFAGEASQINASQGTVASKKAFNALRWIVTVGWAIYPIGYILGYTGGADAAALNLVYNLADFVNKIAFGVVIWAAATSSDANERA